MYLRGMGAGTAYRVYRILMLNPKNDGTVESGATYPGCSREHPEKCDPKSFRNEADARYYAEQRGEIVSWVATEDEAWKQVELLRPPLPTVYQPPIVQQTAAPTYQAPTTRVTSDGAPILPTGVQAPLPPLPTPSMTYYSGGGGSYIPDAPIVDTSAPTADVQTAGSPSLGLILALAMGAGLLLTRKRG